MSPFLLKISKYSTHAFRLPACECFPKVFQTSLLDIEHIFRIHSPALHPPSPMGLFKQKTSAHPAACQSRAAQRAVVLDARPQITCSSKAKEFGLERSGSQTALSSQTSHRPPKNKPEPDFSAEDSRLMGGVGVEKSSSGRSEWDEGEEVEDKLELMGDQRREDESRRSRGERAADLG